MLNGLLDTLDLIYYMCYDYMAVFKFYFDKKFLADFKFTFGVYGFECIGADLTQKEKAFGVYQRLNSAY